MAPRHGCVLSRAPVTAAPLFKGRHANFQTPIWAQIRLPHTSHSAVTPAAAERLAKAISASAERQRRYRQRKVENARQGEFAFAGNSPPHEATEEPVTGATLGVTPAAKSEMETNDSAGC
jgi:hypothetical protein